GLSNTVSTLLSWHFSRTRVRRYRPCTLRVDGPARQIVASGTAGVCPLPSRTSRMMHRSIHSIPRLLFIALLATGCASGAGAPSVASGGPTPEVAEEYEALYRARQDSARMRHTEADVRFMTHMIDHHAQALEM